VRALPLRREEADVRTGQCYAVHIASLQLHGLQTVDPEWQAKGGLISERNDKIREGLTAYIKSKVGHVPGLVEKLVPDYPPLARRLVVDAGWYDCLTKDNVDLDVSGIDQITPAGIRSKDGTERYFDVVILALGFDVNNFFHPMKYYGRNDAEVHDAWQKDGARSYLGMSHLSMPNFFSTLGREHSRSVWAF
jgi:4-hydroxyacetophenone monooxygenase